MEGHRVKLTEVNPYLVCVLCHGYLVDATTIAECLHSFCRSCIFRQLERKSICPICETHVHNTKLYRSLRPDKTLQDIVYKLVPGLFHNEMQRRRDFYKNHPHRDEHLEPECRGVGLDRLIYSPDDQISLSLEFYDEEREKEEWSNNSSPKPPQFAPSGPKRYLQCPAGFKMLHLKKFLRQKYGLSSNCNVDIMYRRECLPDSYSLMDVAYIYTWKRNSPMRFYYRMPEVVMKQLTAPPLELPSIESTKESKKNEEEKETSSNSPIKIIEKKSDENNVENNKENDENIVKTSQLDKTETPEKEKVDEEKKEDKKKISDAVEPQANSMQASPRALSKQDELSVSVLLSLGQCRVDNKDDHKFLVPHPVTPKNGIVEKKNGKISPKPSVNKIASDLAEHKAQQPQLQNSSPQMLQSPLSSPNHQLNMTPQQKQLHIQKQKQLQQMQQQKQKQQMKNQHLQQQKQQQFLHQKQQMHQLMQQQQQKLQQHLQQQHLLQQQQFQQIHLQQVQRHQMQQLQTQQPQILQLQVQPQLQLQQVIHQMKETKPQDQQSSQLPVQHQPAVGEQSGIISNQVKQVTNQMLKVSKSPPVLQQSQVQPPPTQLIAQQQSPQHLAQQPPQLLTNQQTQQPTQHLVQQQPQQHLVQQQPQQNLLQQQSPQHLSQKQSTQPSIQQQLSQQPVQQQLPLLPVQQQPTQQPVQHQKNQQQPLLQSGQAQPQPQQLLSQKSQNDHQSPPHQKSWPEPGTPENPAMNGTASVKNPQVTLNTSNGSVTIMAQLKTPPIVSSTLGATATSNSPGSPIPTMNGKSPETPRPQGIHQNLPRTVLPKSPFLNGKSLQKSIQQKNISGQRLNNNVPENKNGLIQQSNINNRLPTFPKNGSAARKAGIPGGVISKTGPTLDQRIQQLYNSGQNNKPPSPNGNGESRLASWLNNRFKPQPVKEEAETTTPASPPTSKEVSMQRYKRKLQEMQKVQEICEITQENPKPDDAKRRREVTPDVSIELMRAADMKKLDNTKKEKRPVPGLKSIQEVGTKRKKEEDSALDLSRPQLPWLLSRPGHYIPSPRPT
ncbi:protein suppressor 2 of zeste [Halyomorpha halys]|uniref:protein suppressor 2 of zeste n=1 Tax=Halyomorpha halys TaxID=286706 RepID=UPI0006D51173|nr:histone-lysine N-methyltransferase 2D-like [Halyomorpha halys]XP_014290556.1 histone-lysine N-methyltransferase 2D-like [Halyomorpha halys]